MPSVINYLVVHGAYGSPQENWFPWLKQKLEQKKSKVFDPQFPTPENQNIEAWYKIAESALKECDPKNTILIGHSTGAVFVLRMAERTDQPFRAIFSLCPFMQDLGNAVFDPLNASFIKPPFNAKACQRGASKIVCFAGDNDPYVPLSYTQDLANKVNADLNIVRNGGHLNAASGYLEFKELLDRVIIES